MRGTERRTSVGGRRATDLDASARAGVAIPAWVRIGILVLALALSAYSLLHARQLNSKPRGSGAIAADAVDDNAALMAARLDAAVTIARAGARAAAQAEGGAEARLRAARAIAPGGAFAIVDARDAVQGAAGAAPERGRRGEASSAVAADGARWLRARAWGHSTATPIRPKPTRSSP